MMKPFWTWLQNLFSWKLGSSEFDTKSFLYKAEEARIEAIIKHHRPAYSKSRDDRAA